LLDYQKKANQTLLMKDFETNTRLFRMDENPSPQKAGQHSPSNHKVAADESPALLAKDKILRGNMGFCPLDMSLVNNCGIPSLWVTPRQLLVGGSKLSYTDSKGRRRQITQPFIKPLQKRLVKKLSKVYELLRFHKVFETEKYFGRTMSVLHQQSSSLVFQDYFFFSTDFLRDKFKRKDPSYKEPASFQNLLAFFARLKENPAPFQLLSGCCDSYAPDLPLLGEVEQPSFKLVQSDNKILKGILSTHGFVQTDSADWNLLWTCVNLSDRP
jgi:hypothetical protein